jgi:hypothetical protein
LSEEVKETISETTSVLNRLTRKSRSTSIEVSVIAILWALHLVELFLWILLFNPPFGLQLGDVS